MGSQRVRHDWVTKTFTFPQNTKQYSSSHSFKIVWILCCCLYDLESFFFFHMLQFGICLFYDIKWIDVSFVWRLQNSAQVTQGYLEGGITLDDRLEKDHNFVSIYQCWVACGPFPVNSYASHTNSQGKNSSLQLNKWWLNERITWLTRARSCYLKELLSFFFF